MKLQFNKYWIIVALVTVANILIFNLFSKWLEGYIVADYAKKQVIYSAQ